MPRTAILRNYPSQFRNYTMVKFCQSPFRLFPSERYYVFVRSTITLYNSTVGARLGSLSRLERSKHSFMNYETWQNRDMLT